MQLKSRSSVSAQPGQSFCVDRALSVWDGKALLKPMIMRLEVALGRDGLTQSLVLVSKPSLPPLGVNSDQKNIGFVVGYSGSVHSQAALDLALCMAHQTRLVKPNPVVVHVVYVVDQTCHETIANADRVLWQARCLASEWRGSLNAHLRIGQVATQLSQIADEMDAAVLLLGCRSKSHRLVEQLAPQISCSVLGLP